MNRIAAVSLVALVAVACGRAPEVQIKDVRVPIPTADPNMVDFVGGEAVIEPGQQKMLCFHMQWDGGEFTYNGIDILQGKFGHHAVLLAAKEPKAPGTMEDCTEASKMSQYDV